MTRIEPIGSDSMKKHAYLIMAHNNFYVLEKLLNLLDDPRNDIFIHIDKKTVDFDFGYFQALCKKAGVYYPRKRIDVGWAKPSMVEAELQLFHAAAKRGPYHCYHLISGSDMPLKTQDEIHELCEEFTVNRLCYASSLTKWDRQRLCRYHNVIPGKGKISRRLNGYLDVLQEKLQVDRLKRRGMQPQKGGQWGSFTHDAVRCLLDNERKIRKMVRFSSCPDEVYKQVVLMHEGHPVDPEDWRYLINVPPNPSPITFTVKDFDSLISQKNKVFARKFVADVDREVVDLLFEYLSGGQKGA